MVRLAAAVAVAPLLLLTPMVATAATTLPSTQHMAPVVAAVVVAPSRLAAMAATAVLMAVAAVAALRILLAPAQVGLAVRD
jgi:hypothetical protein